jgi:hypothetical protein
VDKLPDADAIRDESTEVERSMAADSEQRHLDSLFELEGLGRELWEGIDPDEYVRELRAGWD